MRHPHGRCLPNLLLNFLFTNDIESNAILKFEDSTFLLSSWVDLMNRNRNLGSLLFFITCKDHSRLLILQKKLVLMTPKPLNLRVFGRGKYFRFVTFVT